MEKKEFAIVGMTCRHCVMAVKQELSKIEGLTVLDVDIGRALLRFDAAVVSEAAIVKAVEEAGYAIVGS